MTENNEEALREAACIGDLEEAKNLIQLGVNVNSGNKVNGWTPLHWAAKRGHTRIVEILLKAGAMKDITNHKDETAGNLAINDTVRELLGAPLLGNTGRKAPSNSISFTPNYLENPEFIHAKSKTNVPFRQSRTVNGLDDDSNIRNCGFIFQPRTITCTAGNQWCPSGLVIQPDTIILCVRLASMTRSNVDFTEIEINRGSAPSLHELIEICCQHIDDGIKVDHVQKVRKLPNTILRTDSDVQRLTDYQSLELVLQPEVIHPLDGVSASSTQMQGHGDQAESKYMKKQVAKLVF